MQDNFIFVCYDHGTGGERAAHMISTLDQCYRLPVRRVGTRTITQDCFNKALISYKGMDWRSEIQKPVPKEKLHVVPSHIDPDTLREYFPHALYVVINFPNDPRRLHRSLYRKVWLNTLPTFAERVGYAQRRGYKITADEFEQLKSPLNNAQIECVFKNLVYTKENRKLLFQDWMQCTGMNYKDDDSVITFDYLEEIDLMRVAGNLQ